MQDSRALVLCFRVPFGCWSTDYRRYLLSREQILGFAKRVLGTRMLAESWLIRPAPALGGREPCSLISTHLGRALVENLLMRIEYGVYT
ncbi:MULTISPECIES: MbcA/ParS/Xre antitoxin family protein [unclassified Pseudomonas]|uniref:antitoxin Xre/MbcA/ParS toxin-binding domain-containing protein n=1 Tax=unclassified Pseudomonas TaxID=196821 RepID=UPI0011A9DB55